jgi:hypothetical protein
MWMMFYGAYLVMFEDTDDDDTAKKMWKQYLVDNLTQQYNPVDLIKTAKTFGVPVTLAKLHDFVVHGTQLAFSSASYMTGNDDMALTKKGDLRGWNNFAKTIPYLASYKDMMNKISRDKSGILGAVDWMYGGVRMK